MGYENSREMMRAADEAFEKKDYTTAETLLLQLTQANSPFADAYAVLGMIYFEQGRFSDAITYLEKAIVLNPNYAEAMLYLAVIYHDLGLYPKGKQLEQRLSQLPRLSGIKSIASPFRARLANMHADIGDLYHSLGCYDDALAQYAAALRIEPHYADIRLKHAICTRENTTNRDHLAAAVKELTALIEEHPRYADAYLELGITQYLGSHWKEAKAAWEKLSKLSPSHPQVTVYLKLVATKLGTKSTPVALAAKIKPISKKKTQPLPKAPDKKPRQGKSKTSKTKPVRGAKSKHGRASKRK